MFTVFITDIFGQSDAFKQLFCELINSSEEALVIDPYQGQMIDFDTEQQAYLYFNEQIGLQGYSRHIKDLLTNINQPFNLIAFSVGGSAIWLNSFELANTQVNKVVCFYPSQIRHHLSIIPSVAIELVLPRYEPHFDIDELTLNLNNHKQVSLVHTEFLHGFMNRLSKNYDQQGYHQYKHKLQTLIVSGKI